MPQRHGRSAPPRRARGEAGAVLLEAALVTPLLLALLLAAIEGGIAFYERLSVAHMSLAGARSASGQGSEALADYHVLRAVRSGGGMAGGQVSVVVVYRATGPGDRVPDGCRSAGVTGVCNRYAAGDLARDVSDFGCTGPPGPTTKIDSPWCPTGRKTALSGPGGPPDYVGVYVEALHHDLTGILGDSITLRSDSIFRIEPRTLS